MSLKEYFAFLDAVRASGAINMFAAPKALQEKFDLSKEEAMEIFVAWTETYSN